MSRLGLDIQTRPVEEEILVEQEQEQEKEQEKEPEKEPEKEQEQERVRVLSVLQQYLVDIAVTDMAFIDSVIS